MAEAAQAVMLLLLLVGLGGGFTDGEGAGRTAADADVAAEFAGGEAGLELDGELFLVRGQKVEGQKVEWGGEGRGGEF